MLQEEKLLRDALSPGTFYPAVTDRTDAAGNQDWGVQDTRGELPNQWSATVHEVRSRSFYGADQRLRVVQKNEMTRQEAVTLTGVWEEYRYDPLGRRIMVRSNAEELCNANDDQCVSHITRYVWSGDRILWALRARAQDGDNLESRSTTGDMYGIVSYTHGGGIDRRTVR